ncbi:hypothetical protein FVR03_10970 [Pontibacter qinzhouensis]|uniref:Lipoprotein n=1 Tax=Pontibacter qinzhouensis TaxID=2603253 RepID=A0A5C8K5U6_9BACT|nr:hypothetical protein [Pontibacter qinzhouensis]TXK46398.1 hypothetical protein FVR03_10970 [Pontibacter qinzhouensis]
MLRKTLWVPFLLSLLLVACSEPAQIEGFDSTGWKADRLGCAGTREKMQQEFEQVRQELYTKGEAEIISILGRPDGEQLMARGQRIFYYYLEPGSQCKQKNNLSEANRAEVRLNALNKVSEVTYLRPIPK